MSTDTYDGLGRLSQSAVKESSTSSIVTTTEYDALGRVWKKSNPVRGTPAESDKTQLTYDVMGRLTRTNYPDGSQLNSNFDANQVTVTDAASSARINILDAFGRITNVTEDPTGSNYHTRYTYDILDNLTQVCQNLTSSCGETRTFNYDALSRLTSAANPETKNLATTYAYDANSNLVTKTNPNGVITCYGVLSGSTCDFSSGYDALNRVIKKSYSDGVTPSVTYTWDTVFKGHLTSVANSLGSNPVSTTSYSAYDALGRVIASSQATSQQTYIFTNYSYNLAGGLTSLTYPSGRMVNTSYDGAGRFSGVTLGGTNAPYVSGMAYTPHGAVQQMTLGNGLSVATPYSADRLQMQSVTATAGGTTRLSLGFYYCPSKALSCTTNNGNVMTETMSTLRQDYVYDKVNRLTSAAETGGTSEWSQSYGYDPYGNRWVSASTGLTVSGFTPTTSSFYDTYNRLNLTVGSAYDNAGNQTQQGGFAQTYDAEGHVKSSTVNSAVTTYSYDGDGRRVNKVSGGVTTVYVYDAQGQLAAEYATAIAASPCRTCYRTEDHVGSTRLLTDGSGNTVSQHDLLPWGEEIPAGVGGRGSTYGAVDNVTQRFTGKERDVETGLDFFGARYFSGPQGRFTSPDPVMSAPERLRDPQQFNRYAYARNNPLRFLDPTGERLQLSGDVNEAQKELCEMLGTSDCASRISYNSKTNTITVDMNGIDLAQNEGASLLNNLVSSSNLYDLTIGSEYMTAAGKMSLNDAIANLNNAADPIQYRSGRPDSRRPATGIDSLVAINPAIATQYKDSQGLRVPLWATMFHGKRTANPY